MKIRHVARISVSNVDKKSAEGELPVRLCNYTDVYNNERITSDLSFMPATASQEQVREFHLNAGDVVITKDSETPDDIGVPAFVPNEIPGLVCGYHLAIVRPDASVINGRYLYWAIKAAKTQAQFSAMATGITRFGLRHESIGSTELPVPSLSAQLAIADFLDAETARLDGIVERRIHLTELLVERWRASLVEVFARVVNRSRPLRAHAEVVLGRQRSPENDAGPFMVPYLRAANVKDGALDLSDVKTMNFSPPEQVRFAVRSGDILITEGAGSLAAVGASAVWRGDLPEPLCFQNTLLRARPRAGIDAEWLAWWCRYAYLSGLFASVAGGANIYHLSADRVRALRCALPPHTDQLEAAAELEASSGAVGRKLDAMRTQIELLLERRQALIDSAVTGQIPIPGVAA